ncbi:hypothetical protein QL285_094012 [Trifolium repens]|nr:hypothetical protein QL285_094012 [Trifolium repens]
MYRNCITYCHIFMGTLADYNTLSKGKYSVLLRFIKRLTAIERGLRTWLYPKGMRQPKSRVCGYYVMKNMFDIVSTNITESWVEVFNDPKVLTEDELYDLRLLWATYFLELYSGH